MEQIVREKKIETDVEYKRFNSSTRTMLLARVNYIKWGQYEIRYFYVNFTIANIASQ